MKTFEEKLKSMTAKDVVLAMIAGLEREWVKVDMMVYGAVDDNGVCFGCAATNTLCQINQQEFDADSIEYVADRSNFIRGDLDVVNWFEAAVNGLRCGQIADYNFWMTRADLTNLLIPEKFHYYSLPYLGTDNYKDRLQAYRDFANSL